MAERGPDHEEIQSITIVFEKSDGTTRTLSYKHNSWLCEGPIYPRFLKLMDVLTRFVREGTL